MVMVRKIFNASNVLGAAAFAAMIGIVAAVESDMYVLAFILLVAFEECARLSIREDGQIK